METRCYRTRHTLRGTCRPAPMRYPGAGLFLAFERHNLGQQVGSPARHAVVIGIVALVANALAVIGVTG